MFRDLDLKGLFKADGGRINKLLDRHRKRAIEDCEDRPGDKSVRKVTIELLVTPVPQQEGAVTDVSVEIEISSKLPKHRSRPINCLVRAGGRAIFNDMSEGDVDQRTLDMIGATDDDDVDDE